MSRKALILLAILGALVVTGSLWLTSRGAAPRKATLADSEREAQAGGYRIVGVDDLAAWLEKDPRSVLLVDTRQDWEFQAGRIPGSVSFPMEPTTWARWRKADRLKTLLGPDLNRRVVFY
jgi:3-mercaptopyruvate sulfurtransferase SseA